MPIGLTSALKLQPDAASIAGLRASTSNLLSDLINLILRMTHILAWNSIAVPISAAITVAPDLHRFLARIHLLAASGSCQQQIGAPFFFSSAGNWRGSRNGPKKLREREWQNQRLLRQANLHQHPAAAILVKPALHP
jgi:hypothetical protein